MPGIASKTSSMRTCGALRRRGAPRRYNESMRRLAAFVLLLAVPVSAQTRRPPRKPAAPPPPPAMKKIAADVKCPAPLGVGVKTNIAFCEVMAGRDPAGGVLIQI